MTDQAPATSALTDLSQRRQRALEGIVEGTERTRKIVERADRTSPVFASAERQTAKAEEALRRSVIGVGQVGVVSKVLKAADSKISPAASIASRLPKFEMPTVERIDIDAICAEQEAQLATDAAELAKVQEEAVQREIRMIEVLEAVRDSLHAQQAAQRQDAVDSGRWQRAIYVMTVLPFLVATVFAVASFGAVWWVVLLTGVGAAGLSAAVLEWAGLLRRPGTQTN